MSDIRFLLFRINKLTQFVLKIFFLLFFRVLCSVLCVPCSVLPISISISISKPPTLPPLSLHASQNLRYLSLVEPNCLLLLLNHVECHRSKQSCLLFLISESRPE